MKKNISGFTLLEMLVSVAIAAILATIALPAFQGVIASNQINATSQRFHTALLYARSEAIKRGFPVSVCVSNSAQTACDTSRKDYAKGWIVFSDYDGDGVFNASITADTTGDGVQDKSESILQVSKGADDKLSISNAGVFADSISYRPTGQVSQVATAPNDRFYVNKDSDAHTNVIVTATGRSKVCSVAVPSANAMC